MISKALQFTRDVLDQFLRNRFALDESRVQLNALIDPNGAVPAGNVNKVVMSLINIEKETAKPYYERQQKIENGNFSQMNPAERYNLDILISASFDDYNETLKFLNAVILFFQINARLDATSFSTMPADLCKLEFEIEKINYHQMQSLWTAMGAKYQPSVIYKMRLVTIQGEVTKGYTAAVSNVMNEATA